MSDVTFTDYDPLHPLDHGIALIEASAGTGKTHNITNLVLRLVTERGVKLSDILVVTFTRAATAELKDRIRLRLGQAAAILAGTDPAEVGAEDEILTGLAARAEAARSAHGQDWGRRVRDALESFDEAFVSTIHGFCQRMLQQNAFESDADFGLELVDDTGPLLEEIVDDFLTRERYDIDAGLHGFLVEACGFKRDALLRLARTATDDPDIRVTPAHDPHRVADGRAAARDFLAANPDWVDEVAQAVEDARGAGLFKPAQRKFKAVPARKQAQAIQDWLETDPDPVLAEAPTKAVAYFFDHKAMKGQLADPEVPFTHEVVEKLAAVLSYRKLAASWRRSAFVEHVRRELDRRNASHQRQSYQDLMRGLARRLRGDGVDPRRDALVDAVGGRFEAALIDEFQDTDNLQWVIFRTLFGAGGHYLYLIGDPKQAIYGFRGANVHVYLDAKRHAQAQTFTMKRNFRSDQRYVDAMNHLMDRPGFFAEDDIEYVEVDAPTREAADRIRFVGGWGEPAAAPLQLRFVDTGLDPSADAGASIGKGRLNELLPQRVADDIAAFLESGASLHDPKHPDGFRPVGPGDIAVLVRKGKQARATQQALNSAGVPAVLGGADSVLESDECSALLRWLEAVAQPARDSTARAAALTPLFRWTIDDLRAVEDEQSDAVLDWETWITSLARWQRELKERGFLKTFRRVMASMDIASRLLQWPDGERKLTNVLHVVELLHAAERQDHLGLAGLIGWLRRQRANRSLEAEAVELRLERDDDAVNIVTMHGSKGLQYPIVWAPYLWDGRLLFPGEDQRLVLPDPDRRRERLLDVHMDKGREPKASHLVLKELETQRENLRLLYVALTRARYRCVVYGGNVKEFETSALAAALYGDQAGDTERPDRLKAAARRTTGAASAALLAPLHALAQRSAATADGHPTIAVSTCDPPEGRRWTGQQRAAGTLIARDFLRAKLDRVWRRCSYTALTQGKHGVPAADDGPEAVPPAAAPAGDPEREAFDDDGAAGPASDRGSSAPRVDVPEDAEPVPLAGFRAGADAGTFLHEVFELFDFTLLHPDADDAAGRQELSALLDELLPRHSFDAARWRDELVDGLIPVLRTPLGGPVGASRLCDIARRDRLDELRFDLPLAGGDRHGTPGHEARIESDAFAATFLARAGDERMRPAYIAGLQRMAFGKLAGFLNGSIDLVFRDGVGPDARWYVVDYKSNRIDPQRSGTTTVHHYAPALLRWQMEQHHYYLQYHLYTVGLHRYLRWRLGERYDYESHFGGVYYLFLRGMVGSAAPDGTTPGVFHDRPPLAVVDALDRLFADPAGAARDAGGES